MPRSRTATVTFDATGRIGSASRLVVTAGGRGPEAGAATGVGSGARASFGVGAGIGRAGEAATARSAVARRWCRGRPDGVDLRRLHIRHGHVGRYRRRLGRARSPGDDAAILGDRHQRARRREEHRQPRQSTGAGCLGIGGQRGQVNRQRRSLGSGNRRVVGRRVRNERFFRDRGWRPDHRLVGHGRSGHGRRLHRHDQRAQARRGAESSTVAERGLDAARRAGDDLEPHWLGGRRLDGWRLDPRRLGVPVVEANDGERVDVGSREAARRGRLPERARRCSGTIGALLRQDVRCST